MPQPEETHRPDATEELGELLGARILVLDGAMGTMIQEHRLDEAAYRGDASRRTTVTWPATTTCSR